MQITNLEELLQALGAKKVLKPTARSQSKQTRLTTNS